MANGDYGNIWFGFSATSSHLNKIQVVDFTFAFHVLQPSSLDWHHETFFLFQSQYIPVVAKRGCLSPIVNKSIGPRFVIIDQDFINRF